MSVLFITPVYADQHTYIKNTAVKRLNRYLYKKQTIRIFCPPCGDTHFSTTTIQNFTVKKERHTDYYRLVVNKKIQDIAYIYIRQRSGWKNLAVLCGLDVHSVPVFLHDNRVLPIHKKYRTKICNYMQYFTKGEPALSKKQYSVALYYYQKAQQCYDQVHATNYKLALTCEKLQKWEKAGDTWFHNIKYWPNDKYASARAALAFCKSNSRGSKKKALKAIRYTLQLISGPADAKSLTAGSNKIYSSLKKDPTFLHLANALHEHSITISDGIIYTVRLYDTLVRIAAKHNLASWKTIYRHKANSRFRELRPDPSLIFPGDTVFIPLTGRKEGATGPDNDPVRRKQSQPVFRLKTEKIIIYTKAGRGNNNTSIYKYSLITKQEEITRSVTSGHRAIIRRLQQGIIYEEVDPLISSARLKVWTHADQQEPAMDYRIRIGHLPPLDTMYGKQVRLSGLGFNCREERGAYGKKTRQAVRAFQQKNGLPTDGWPGPRTTYYIKKLYSR